MKTSLLPNGTARRARPVSPSSMHNRTAGDGLGKLKVAHWPRLLFNPWTQEPTKLIFFQGVDAACWQCSSQGVLPSVLGGCMRFPSECLGINIHHKVLKVPRFPPPPALFRGSANCKVCYGIPLDSQSNANHHENHPSLNSLQGIWVLYVGHWYCIYILSPTVRETLYIEI